MGVPRWSRTPALNKVADPEIEATDGASGRSFARSLRGIMAAMRRLADDQGGVLVTGGRDNAYTVSTGSGIADLRSGLSLLIRADRTNTADAFLNVDGLGPRPWRDAGGAALPEGSIATDHFYSVVYDDAAGVWRTPLGAPSLFGSSPIIAAGGSANRTLAARFGKSIDLLDIAGVSGLETDIGQAAGITAAFGAWRTANATSFGAQYSRTTGRTLVVPEGTFNADLLVQTPGTGASIVGRGFVSRLQGACFDIKDFRSYFSSFSITGAATSAEYAVQLSGNRRGFLSSDMHVRDRKVGLRLANTGAGDNLCNWIIEKCGVAVDVQETLGAHLTNFDVLNFDTTATERIGFKLRAIGELKMVNCRSIGGAPNISIVGSTAHPAVEYYFSNCTGTRAENRNLPIAGVTDDNGFAKVQIATKVPCTIQFRPTIMTFGAMGESARTLVTVNEIAGGQIDFISIGDKQLLSASVPWTGDRFKTCTAAAINAGTAGHGYTAKAFGAALYIYGAAALGAAVNGLVVDAGTSGGMTLRLQQYVVTLPPDCPRS